MNEKTFGNFVMLSKTELKISDKQLSIDSGVSRSSLWNMVNNLKDANMNTAERIMRAMNLDWRDYSNYLEGENGSI